MYYKIKSALWKRLVEMDFHSALSPQLYLARILGVATQTCNRENGRRIYLVSRAGVKYCTITFIVMLALMIYLYNNRPANYDLQPNLFSISAQAIGMGDFVLYSVSHYSCIFHRKKISTIWCQLNVLSRKIFGPQHVVYRRTFFFIIGQSILYFFLLCIANMSNTIDSWYRGLFYAYFVAIDFTNAIAGLSITCCLFVLSGLFENLTLKLRELGNIAEKCNFFENDIFARPISSAITPKIGGEPLIEGKPQNRDLSVISRSSKLHPKKVEDKCTLWSSSRFVKELNLLAEFQSTLYELSQDVEQVYGPQTLFGVGQAFISTTFALFICSLLTLDLKVASQITSSPTLIVLWEISIAARLLVLVYCCNSVSTQADLLAEALSGLLVSVKTPQVKEEIEMFTLQLMHNRVRFSACGFFPLDATLLYGVIGGVTTYLVILIQFQMASDSK